MFLKFYHISLINLGNTITLIPKIPSNIMTMENNYTPRICVCASIVGCINGLNYPDNHNFINKTLHLYQCIVDTEKTRIIQPTRTDVEDGWVTGEFWLLDPTEFKFIRSYKVFKHAHIKDTAYSRFIFTSDEDDLPLDFRDGDIVYGEETNFSMLMIDFDHHNVFTTRYPEANGKPLYRTLEYFISGFPNTELTQSHGTSDENVNLHTGIRFSDELDWDKNMKDP